MFDPSRFNHPDDFEAFQEEWEEQRRLNDELIQEAHAEYDEWLRLVDATLPLEEPSEDGIILPAPEYVTDKVGAKKDSIGIVNKPDWDPWDDEYEGWEDDSGLPDDRDDAGFPNCIYCGPECLFWGGDSICDLEIQAMAEQDTMEWEERYRLTILGRVHLGIRDLVRCIIGHVQSITERKPKSIDEEEIPF